MGLVSSYEAVEGWGNWVPSKGGSGTCSGLWGKGELVLSLGKRQNWEASLDLKHQVQSQDLKRCVVGSLELAGRRGGEKELREISEENLHRQELLWMEWIELCRISVRTVETRTWGGSWKSRMAAKENERIL